MEKARGSVGRKRRKGTRRRVGRKKKEKEDRKREKEERRREKRRSVTALTILISRLTRSGDVGNTDKDAHGRE